MRDKHTNLGDMLSALWGRTLSLKDKDIARANTALYLFLANSGTSLDPSKKSGWREAAPGY